MVSYKTMGEGRWIYMSKIFKRKPKSQTYDISNLFINEVTLSGTNKNFTFIEPMIRSERDDILKYHLNCISLMTSFKSYPEVTEKRKIFAFNSVWSNDHFAMTTLDGQFISKCNFYVYSSSIGDYIRTDYSNLEVLNSIEVFALLEQCLPPDEVIEIIKNNKITDTQLDLIIKRIATNREQYGFQKKLTMQK